MTAAAEHEEYPRKVVFADGKVAWDYTSYGDGRREKALFCIDPTDHTTIFEGVHDPNERWNGFATPAFPKDQAERVVDWVMSNDPSKDYHQFEWDSDGRTLIMLDLQGWEGLIPDDEIFVDRIEPLPDGTYPIGSHSWTWQVFDDTHAPPLSEPEALDEYLAACRVVADVYSEAHNAVNAALAERGVMDRLAVNRIAGDAAVRAFQKGLGAGKEAS